MSVTVTIDGVDVTNISIQGSWTPRLNRPAQAQVVIPMQESSGLVGEVGDLLKIEALIGTTTEIVFHGRILNREVTADENTGYVTYNAQDAMELWQWRPVRDDTGDFSLPTIIADYVTAPQILEAMLNNTVSNTGGGPPTAAEGAIELDMGTFAGGGVSVEGAPVDWPMQIMDLFGLLVSTGQLDAIITYTDPGGGVTGTIDGYNGDYGTDLSSSIDFDYGQGNYNVRALRWNQDMTNMVNKYWLYGGPRIATAADPAGDQHWCFNVTGFSTLASPPGGQSVDSSNNPVGPPWTNNQLGERIYDSRVAYNVRMMVDIFDAYDEDCIPGLAPTGHNLFKRRWQTFSWGAANPRDIIHVTPTRGTEIGTFGIGDLVGVSAAAVVCGGFSGAQRVYQYTISWDQDGVLELSELQTSADMEGL